MRRGWLISKARRNCCGKGGCFPTKSKDAVHVSCDDQNHWKKVDFSPVKSDLSRKKIRKLRCDFSQKEESEQQQQKFLSSQMIIIYGINVIDNFQSEIIN
jgi:hypothetical protein